MTTEEAVALAKSEFWTSLTFEEIAKFQLFEPKLCMPFSIFHEAVEKTLGRPVYTHEFGLNWDGLKSELLGDSEPPTFEDIINMIPPDKRVIIVSPKATE